MEDKLRFRIMAAMGVMVLLGFFAWAFQTFMAGDAGSALVLFAITGIMCLFAARNLRRAGKEIKVGLPLEDEMSRKVKQKAGYFAYLATLYVVLGLMWASEADLAIFAGKSAYDFLLMVMMAMFALFFGFWEYFRRKGE